MRTPLGIAMGVRPLIAYNYTASLGKRTVSLISGASIVMGAYTLACFVSIMLFPEILVGMFLPIPEVMPTAVSFMRTYIFSIFAIGFLELFNSIFQSIGQWKTAIASVFIGRGADAILKELNPLNIFVYADKETKLKRCLERGEPGETEKEILKQMQRIDKSRANTRNLLTDSMWGKKETYHLCLNTSGLEIKAMIPSLSEYAKQWFEMHDSK